MERLVSVAALLSGGLLAGAFACGFFAVVPTFYEVPLEVHLTYRDVLMRHNGIYMQLVMPGSILTPLWWAFTIDRSMSSRWLAISASLLAAIAFLVTRFGNVPINRLIKTWSAAAPPADYEGLLHLWLIFNHIRTLAALSGFACVVIAAALSRDR